MNKDTNPEEHRSLSDMYTLEAVDGLHNKKPNSIEWDIVFEHHH